MARGQAHAESDIDILVAFQRPIDGWTYAAMARELEEELKTRVDLVTENALSDNMRPFIEPELTELYDQTE